MPGSSKYHYAFDEKYHGVPNELKTEAVIFPFPAGRGAKGIKTSILWDTGATHSCLSPNIVSCLGLKPIDTIVVHGINSSQAADVVLASIGFSNGLFLADRRFSVSKIPGTDVLIGMDIIMMGDFAISNGGGATQFSFAIPPFKDKISFEEKAHLM
jgi:hypothetical protein